MFHLIPKITPNRVSSLIPKITSHLLLFGGLYHNPHSPLPFSSSSSKHDPTKPSSFTVSYLVNRCGLTPDSALSLSSKLHLKSPTNPDSVIAFLRSHGFSEADVSLLISRNPSVLSSNPIKTLKPKIDFFASSGIPSPLLVRILSSNPSLFKRSLSNQLIPSFRFLRDLLGTPANLADALRRSTLILQLSLLSKVAPNIATLRSHGVPLPRISKIITTHPRTLAHPPERFSRIVSDVHRLGFDPSNSLFLLAVRARSVISASKWDAKVRVYKDLGWSDDHVLSAFRRQPLCMIISEAKIRKLFHFYTAQLGMDASAMSRRPNFLLVSLENRVVPRCSVMRILTSRGLVDSFSWNWVLACSDSQFLEKYVHKYEDQVPDLLAIYRSKRGSSALDNSKEAADSSAL